MVQTYLSESLFIIDNIEFSGCERDLYFIHEKAHLLLFKKVPLLFKRLAC